MRYRRQLEDAGEMPLSRQVMIELGEEDRAMTTADLMGVFVTFGFFLLLSLCLFIAELIAGRRWRRVHPKPGGWFEMQESIRPSMYQRWTAIKW